MGDFFLAGAMVGVLALLYQTFVYPFGRKFHREEQAARVRFHAAEKERGPLLEPYDWGPDGVPEGQPIRYEPGKGWEARE